MNKEWSLEKLYKGYDDPKFKEDERILDESIKEIIDLSSDLSGDPADVLTKIIELTQKIYSKVDPLFSFAQLQMSVNTSDVASASAAGRLSQKWLL